MWKPLCPLRLWLRLCLWEQQCCCHHFEREWSFFTLCCHRALTDGRASLKDRYTILIHDFCYFVYNTVTFMRMIKNLYLIIIMHSIIVAQWLYHWASIWIWELSSKCVPVQSKVYNYLCVLHRGCSWTLSWPVCRTTLTWLHSWAIALPLTDLSCSPPHQDLHHHPQTQTTAALAATLTRTWQRSLWRPCWGIWASIL